MRAFVAAGERGQLGSFPDTSSVGRFAEIHALRPPSNAYAFVNPSF